MFTIQYPKFQTVDDNGDLLIGGKLYTYDDETDILKDTYSDTLGTKNENPIILNARGEPDNPIYGSGSYKLVLKDASDNVIWTIPEWEPPAIGTNTTDADLSMSDITTNNASVSKHGFCPKLSNDTATYLRGDGTWVQPSVNESSIFLFDTDINDVSDTKHGLCPKAPNDSGQVLRGDGTWGSLPGGEGNTDAALSVSDITTNNVSVSKHGFCPKLSGDTATYLRGDGTWVGPSVNESSIFLADNTTNDVSTSKHGFCPKLANNNYTYLRGDGTWVQPSVNESTIFLSDITINNVSASKHGLCPKTPNDTNKFLRGDGSWATMALPKPVSVEVTSRPDPVGDFGDYNVFYNSDLSKVSIPIMHYISNDSLGEPTTGYLFTPECYPDYVHIQNYSGYNHQTGSNDGRTCAVARLTIADNFGQGDCVCNMGSSVVSGTKAGATHWIANPAGSIYYGQVLAGANYVYLNPVEINCVDQGYDVAAVGYVMNMFRTNATGGLSCVWWGMRFQNQGSQPVDAWITAIGAAKAGIDFTTADFSSTGGGAVSLKAGQKIFFNNVAWGSNHTQTWNGDYIYYDSSAIKVVVGGNTTLKVTSTAIGVFGASGQTQVPGWGTPTDGWVYNNFPGATATLTDCSHAIAMIIQNLKQWGFYAA